MNTNSLLMILVAAVFVTSGCASNAESPAETSVSPENQSAASVEVDRTVEVNGGNFYFEPDNLEISEGETVKFVFINDGGMHDLRIPGKEAGTSVISGGETESFTVTFDEKQKLDFICSVGSHAERGMKGTITVS